MCGICGYIGPKAIEEEQLWKMNNTMYHRGPDDGGVWQFQQGDIQIGLAQRRLSILDLSEMGHQPMLSEDQRYVLVYNGEIYNFQNIRKSLEKKGYRFQSNCDTEVILYAYAEWGKQCFLRFNGMFAAALYDRKERKLILARDRIGKKPLYYYVYKGHFVFASELKPIMEYPYFEKKIDKSVINHYLCNKYLVAPFCIFEHTYKMIPGTILEYSFGKVTTEYYWDVLGQYQSYSANKENSFAICKKSVNKILQDAVAARLVADVPIGTFLSGGIDSTLITAIAQRNTDTPINTYSIGFYDKERNEAPYSAEIAKFLGTNHHEHYVREKDIFDLIDDLSFYYDEPFSDSSQLPTMLVSKYASQDITVALSGDGGDEIFCGYKMYDWTWVAQHADFLGAIASCVPGMGSLKKKLPPELCAFISNRKKDKKTQLYIDVMIEEADKLTGRKADNIKYEHEKRLTMKNWQERRMLLDMQTYLPDEILAKTDRASMKYSLEVRCPLLDYRVIEESFKIPHQYKYHHFDKKYILKEITYDYVPRKLLDRPKKGFGVPLRKWLRTVLKDEISHYADTAILKRQDIFEPEAVKRLIIHQEKSDKIMYSSMLWSFYVFQKWYQMYIEDLW
ncbi:MAG: asparagine synthase (glutamine-hydrolyzing) [Lachnospiraceae bacterium]|nr:asparagine synthase (glutamine-hydrolyzing) [Lachnospiraceae bacterium]